MINEIDISIECYTAMNGQEGLHKLITNEIPHPSLIFLDLNMPRINGHKFLTTIKKHPDFKSTPVVIYSTSSNKKDKDEMMQSGEKDYLVKQTDYALLKENVSRIILNIQNASS